MTDADPTPGRFRRQIIRNTAATAAANAWTIVLSLVSVPLMLRGLGTAGFGTWALLQTFTAMSGWLSLADLGVGVATVRAVSSAAATDDHPAVGRAVGTALALTGAIGAACALAVVVLGRAFMGEVFQVPAGLTDDLRLALLPFGVQVLFELLGSVTGSCLDGLQRIDRSRALDSLRRTLVLGSSVVVALVTEDLAAVVLAAAITTTISTLAAGAVLRAQLGSTRPSTDREEARTLLHYGRRVWLLSGTGVLHRMMDRTIVGVMLGPAAVALVEVATQIQNGVSAALSASSYAATTSAAWVRARADRARLRELLLRGTKYTCLVTLPLCGLVAVLAGPLIEVWLPSGYGDAAPLVVLAVAYLATQAPLATGSNLLVGVGRAGDVLKPGALAVVVNLVTSVVLVELIGIEGAFVGTIVSSLLLTPLLARAIAAASDVSIAEGARTGLLPSVPPTVAAVALSGAVVLLLDRPLAALLVGGALGSLAWIGVAARWSLSSRERSDILGAARRAG